jgi:catechol O-methyltransferase
VYRDYKLAAARKELQDMQSLPKTLLEFGTYVGNSAIAWAAMLREINQSSSSCDFHVYTFELNPEMARIALDFIKLAGVDDVVSILKGPGGESLKKLHAEGKLAKQIDVVFFDHWEEYYLPDLQLCEELGVLKPGSKIIADNTDFPGTPTYLAYMKAGGGEKVRYESRSVQTEEPGKAVSISLTECVLVANKTTEIERYRG